VLEEMVQQAVDVLKEMASTRVTVAL